MISHEIKMKTLNNSVTFHDGDYFIQKVKMKSLCERYETPFYLYDVNYILKQYEQFNSFFQWRKKRIFYAMKANYNPHILGIMNEFGFFLDAVSPAEVIFARSLGFPKDRILFTANNMTDEEMKLVKRQEVLFNIDSLVRLKEYARYYQGSSVSLRINPGVVAGENEKVQTAGDDSKFGILLTDISVALDIAKQHDIKIIGLHEHTGSGISDTSKVLKSMENLLSIANKDDFPNLEFINFGGGFKVPYHPMEAEIDYHAFGEEAVRLFHNFCKEYGRELTLCFEPGKYIVAQSGCLIAKVNTIKENKGRIMIGIDTGFSHMIRPVLYGAYHHIINISNPHGEVRNYDIYGNICESTDCFTTDREISEIRIGDYLAIQNAGAYCRSMASEYNLRPLPSEIMLYNQELLISREKLSHKDLAERVLREYNINI